MSNAIKYRMDQGITGVVTRKGASMVDSAVLGATAFTRYGMPVKVSGNTVIPLALVGDTLPFGFLVRPFPTQGPNASDPLGTAVPPTSGICSILKRGYISVYLQLGAATAAYGSQVFVRYQNPSGSQVVGGLEGATTGNNVALTDCYFTGPADANGNAEIYFDGV